MIALLVIIVTGYGGMCGGGEKTDTGSSTPQPNQAPILATIGPRTVPEGVALTFTISATDPDNDRLTYAAYSLPIGASFSATAHTFAWTPSYSQSGTYNIRFRITDTIGLYAEEIVTVTVTDVAGPNAPSNLIAQVSSLSQIDLVWTDNSIDEIGFKIEHKIGETGTYSQIDTVDADVTSYSSTALSGGISYYYRVRSYNPAGNSAYSNEVSAATTALTLAPSIINNYLTNVSHNTATFYATLNPNGLDTNAYFEYGATTAYGTTSNTYALGNSTTSINVSVDITGLASSTAYHFRLAAANGIGTSYGQDATFTTAATPQLPVVSTTPAVNVSYNSVSLTGTANPNSRSTIAYFQYGTTADYGTNSAPQDIGAGSTDINVTFDLTGILANTVYHYRIVANNIDGLSFGADQVFTTITGPPNARTNSASDITINSAVLNGIVNPNALSTTAYFEWGLNTSYGNSTAVQDIGSGVADVGITATITGLSIDTTYNYRVVAANSLGTTYGANQLFLIQAPAAPSGLTTTAITPSSIYLSWTDNSNNEDGFKIERKTGAGGTYAQVAVVGVNTVSYSDNGLASPVLYYYRIKAFNTIGDSAYSNESSATTPLAWIVVASGGYHTVAIKSDGTLWAWGYNGYGQLGLGDNTDRNTPTQVGSATDWMAVAAGYYHTVALKTNGTIFTWGGNGYGQLGVGDTTARNTPTQTYWWWGGYTDWSKIAAGYYHTMAIKTDGTLWTWGYNWYGQLGLGNSSIRVYPTQVNSARDWYAVAGGCYHTVAVKTTGTLWASGYNGYGQLGLGDTTNRNVFTQVGSTVNWSAVAGGCYHTIGLRGGALWAWGYNGYGQLGVGDNTDRKNPAQEIYTDMDWAAIGGGYHHTVAIKKIGTIWTWGYNGSGQLGQDDTTNRIIPTSVGSATEWAAITSGAYHTVALKRIGTLWSSGANSYGQLGLGDNTDRLVPTWVP